MFTYYNTHINYKTKYWVYPCKIQVTEQSNIQNNSINKKNAWQTCCVLTINI